MKSFTQYVEDQDKTMDMDMEIEAKPDAPGGPDLGDDMGSDDPMEAIREIMDICKRVLGEGDDLGMGGKPPMGLGAQDDETKNIARPTADGPGAPGGMFGMGN